MNTTNTPDLCVFQEDYRPDKLVDRTEQKQTIRDTLQHFQKGEKTQHLYLYGQPGTGKTETVRQELKSSQLQYAEINCFEDQSLHQILVNILHQVGKKLEVYRTGTPTGMIKQKLTTYTEENKLVVFLDEVDKLKEPEAFYTLFNLPNTLLLTASNTTNQELFNDSRVQSRLNTFQQVEYPLYSSQELKEIVSNRLEQAGIQDSGQAVEAIAGNPKVTDARQALTLVSKSLEKDRSNSLSKTDVEQVLQTLDGQVRKARKKDLKPDQEVLLEVIKEEKEVKPSELYEEYGSRVDEPKVERTLRKYLGDLEKRGLIQSNGSARWRTYHAVQEQGFLEEVEQSAVA